MSMHPTKRIVCSSTLLAFTGLVRKEKIVEDVEARNDMLTYLDGDFHIEISDDLYYHCLALVCDKTEADTAAFSPTPARETSRGHNLRLPHRFLEWYDWNICNFILCLSQTTSSQQSSGYSDYTVARQGSPFSQWLEHPTSVRRVTGSTPVGNSNFFFVPSSRQTELTSFIQSFISIQQY